jgi:hypothetical protein
MLARRRTRISTMPFLLSHFRKSVMRARGWFKARVCKSIIEEKDWRARLELLARIYPRSAERPLPPEPDEGKKVSIALVLNTGGKSLAEFVNFPMCDGSPPPAPEQEIEARRPIPTASGRVIWTDEPLPPDDADPNANVAED